MKKRLIIAALFLGIALLGGFFVYSHEKKKQAEQPAQQPGQTTCSTQSTLPKETKDQCLNRITDFDQNALAQEILKVVHYNANMNADYGESHMPAYVFGQYLALRSFNCSLVKERSQSLAKDAQDFVNQLWDFSDTAKNIGKKWFENDLSGKYGSEYYSWAENLALGDLGKVCPDQLKTMCLDLGVLLNNPKNNNEKCSAYCDKLSQYQKDQSIFNNEIIKNIPGNFFGIVERALIAYRFSGEDSATKICGEQGDVAKQDICLRAIYIAESQKYSCADNLQKEKDFICDFSNK